MRAIFGEKASDVKDTSLRTKSSMSGTVVDVRVFTRDGVKKDKRAHDIEELELDDIRKDLKSRQNIIEEDIFERLETLLTGKIADGGPDRKSVV